MTLMHKSMIRLAVISLLEGSICSAQILGIGGASEFTQLLNHAQLVMQYARQAETALRSVQMAQQMVREGQQLVTHPSTSIAQNIYSLSSIMMQSRGLAMDLARMDSVFRQVYVPYNAGSNVGFSSAYNNWVDTALRTINGALNTAGMQGNMLNDEQSFMARITSMMNSPQGRNESLQLGNVIGTETVAQLQKLRQLMIADMTTKGSYTAALLTQQQTQQTSQQNSFTHANWQADQRGW